MKYGYMFFFIILVFGRCVLMKHGFAVKGQHDKTLQLNDLNTNSVGNVDKIRTGARFCTSNIKNSF